MLFHSHLFVFVFLPLVLGGYYAFARRQTAREWLLVGASLTFYGWWDPRFLPLLVGQATFTWVAGNLYLRTRSVLWVGAGIAGNLGSLVFFKYASFFAGTLAQFAGLRLQPIGIALPIGISFFSFQLISYLVDLRRGEFRDYPLRRVILFISLFPHLVAGPIVRHNEIMPQFDADPLRPGLAERFARGLAFFAIGCAKKVLLADELAPVADAAFSSARGSTPALSDAWLGTLAFSVQLFLDFSAYTEMAIGLGLMMGLRFPDNFDVPYRAANLREFWGRWHMTLSRYIRDYLYIPLGGNRRGFARYLLATLVAMGLCGLWHGAAWTFAAWGLMHGAGLIACRAWQARGWRMPWIFGWTLTMLFVLVGWVLFRASEFSAAGNMLAGLAGFGDAPPALSIHPALIVALVVSVTGPSTSHFVERSLRPGVYQGAALALLLAGCLLLTGRGQPVSFIYFQF